MRKRILIGNLGLRGVGARTIWFKPCLDLFSSKNKMTLLLCAYIIRVQFSRVFCDFVIVHLHLDKIKGSD